MGAIADITHVKTEFERTKEEKNVARVEKRQHYKTLNTWQREIIEIYYELFTHLREQIFLFKGETLHCEHPVSHSY